MVAVRTAVGDDRCMSVFPGGTRSGGHRAAPPRSPRSRRRKWGVVRDRARARCFSANARRARQAPGAAPERWGHVPSYGAASAREGGRTLDFRGDQMHYRAPLDDDALGQATWDDLAPLYRELLEAPIAPGEVRAWLAAWSALDARVDEAYARSL